MTTPFFDRRLRFGRFELRPAERLLCADGVALPVGARAFDVLVCLVQRRDRLVTKQELLDRVWSGRIVEEHNVATQIGSLRKLLGPRVIATIPGRGYRFIAPVDDEVAERRPASTADQLVPLLGREADLADLADRLAQQRLVTVVGAGGMGKSLLARHLMARHAQRWAQGACWVDLTDVGDAALLPARIADAVGVRLDGGDAVAALGLAMSGLAMLVTLDNAEHLGAGVAHLAAALLESAPELHLLVTSQTPLRLNGEQVHRLAPLAVPPGPLPVERALGFAAVALFADRARRVDLRYVLDDAGAADAIELCRRLDGLPLAIELAAARAPLVGVHRLVAMLENRLRLLTHNRDSQAPPRQQTLRAALDWSHDLLEETERTVFRRLGVFVGSASLEVVQQVVADEEGPLDAWAVLDALGSLVDRSLVVVVPGDEAEPRYRLLESPRAFALEQLDAAGERPAMQRRHAVAHAARFDAARNERKSGRIGQFRWQRRALQDADNARAAITWAAAADDAATTVSLAATLHLALPRSAHDERMALADRCESLVERIEDPALRLAALQVAVRPMYHPSPARTLELAEQALQLARTLDRAAADRWTLAESLCCWIYAAGVMAQPNLEALHVAQAELDTLEDPAWPALRRFETMEARRVVCMAADDAGRDARMLGIVRRQVELMEEAGADLAPRISLLIDAEIGCGNLQAAIALGERELGRIADSRDDWSRLTIQGALVMALLMEGRAAQARPMLRQTLAIARRFRVHSLFSDLPALLAAQEDRPRSAARLAGHADACYAAQGVTRYPTDLAVRERCLARVRAALGDAETEAELARGRLLGDAEAERLAFADD